MRSDPAAGSPPDETSQASAQSYRFGLQMPLPRACFYFATAAILAFAQGFSQSMVSVNSQQLQGIFGTTQAETIWFSAAYMAPNASLTLALFKLRGQFGLRRFAEMAIVIFLASGLLNFAADDFWSNIATRFLAGCAAAPMSSLAFLYMLDPLPRQRKMNVGLSAALTVMFSAATITRLISPHLLELGSWHGLKILEVSLAAVGLGLIYRFPLLNPAHPMRIEAGDVISFLLIALGFGCLTIVVMTGTQYWWTEQEWLGWTLALAIASLALAIAIELNRQAPLLDIRWLMSPEILHFAAALLLFRLVLSEQSSGAAGFFRAIGLLNEQTGGLWLVVLIATVLGGLICAVFLKPGREPAFHIVALILLIAGSVMDANSNIQTVPRDMYLSQGIIGLAAALFLPPAMLVGIVAAMKKGPDYLLNFVIVFLITQKVGALLGGAIFSSFVTMRTRLHAERLSEALAVSDPLVAERIRLYAQALAPVMPDTTLRNAQSASRLASEIGKQASILAYTNSFAAVAIISGIALALLLGHVAITSWRDRAALKTGDASASDPETPMPTPALRTV